MKKVELKHYSKVSDSYQVKLGNGFGFDFKQEKQAQEFLRKLSKHLTEKLFEMNHLFVDGFSLYRQNWILFKTDSKKQAALLQAERKIKSDFDLIQQSFEKIVWQSNTVNGNYVVYSSFYFIINSLRSVCSYMNDLAERQNLTSLKYSIVILQNSITQIDRDLNEYEVKKATFFFERSRLDDNNQTIMSKVI